VASLRLPGVHSSLYDVLRQRQRVVDKYRDKTGLDTHTHACAALQHKRGPRAVVLKASTRDGGWHPLGTSPTTQAGYKAALIAELQRLADDDEESRGAADVVRTVAAIPRSSGVRRGEKYFRACPCRVGTSDALLEDRTMAAVCGHSTMQITARRRRSIMPAG
jgi:hypothetical protein